MSTEHENRKKRRFLWILLLLGLIIGGTAAAIIVTKTRQGNVPEDSRIEESKPEESREESGGEQEPEPNKNPWLVDPIDDAGAWIGTNPALAGDDGPVNGSYLASTTRDDQGSAVFSRAFDPAIDLRGYKDGYLHMFIYVEDISKLTGGQIELSSSGNPDTRELSWNLPLYVTRSGWNEVSLPFANGSMVGGEIDLKNVNFMRVYMILSEDTKCGIDGLEFTNEEPEEETHLDEKGEFVLDEIENASAWDGTMPQLVSGNAPVGNAYVYTDVTDGDALVLCRQFDNYNVNAFANGYLHAWIYVKDISKATGGQIELTSAGVPDQQETSWVLLNYVTKSGWNEVYLPISKAGNEGGTTDFSKLNYIRIYLLTKGENGLGLDFLSLTNEAPAPVSRIDSTNQFVLDKVEAMETWDGTNPVLATSGQKVGKAWVYTKTRIGDDNVEILTRTFADLNASAYKNGYLHFYLYVEDASAVTGGQIELTSSGVPDSQETSWGFSALELKSGWNNVYLPISEADSVGGGANFGSLNYFRMYVFTSKAQKIGVDYIAISKKAPGKESPIDESGNYIIDEVHSVSPWLGETTLVFNKTAGYDDSADWISTSTTKQKDLVFVRNYADADLSAYKYLHVWVYVDDLSALSGGMIEISSSGVCDTEEISWQLASFLKKNGWNELYLPIEGATVQGGAPDLTAMNYIRMVAMVNSKGANVGIDMVYATNEEPAPEEPPVVEEETLIIDRCDDTDTIFGDGIVLVTSNPREGSGYLKTSSKDCPVACATMIPALNMTQFTEGYLHLWLYVEDAANISYGQVELTSSGASDTNEVSWNVRELGLVNGWNELYLPIAEGNYEGGQPDYSSVNYFRTYVGFAENSFFALDDIYICKEAPAMRIALEPCDEATYIDGTNVTIETNGAREGSGYAKSGESDCPVICATLNPAVDISELENGYLHMFLYADNADIAYGEVELTSSGGPDQNELNWAVKDLGLKKGWNELYLPLAEANANGGDIDLTAVNYVRVYIGFTAPGTGFIGLDDVSITRNEGADTIAYDLAVEEAEIRGILYQGNVNMRSAIKRILEKCSAGEDVTISVFGPSTAAGAGASQGKGFADLIFNYFEGLDGDDSNGNVTRVNNSIGSTEGVYLGTRAEKDLLAYDPDFVVVNISRNDANLSYAVEAYEGLYTKLYNAGIPFICLTTCGEDGLTPEKDMVPLNKLWGVPMISFPTAYVEFTHNTDIPELQPSVVWSGDHVHPSNNGHALIADLVTAFLDSLDGVTAANMDNTLPSELLTRNGFRDSVLIENFYTGDKIEVALDGWTADYPARIYQLSNEGWQTSTVGASITFRFNAGYFYIMKAMSGSSGDLQVTVDGIDRGTVKAYQTSGEVYMNVEHILHDLTPGEHTVTLTLVDNPSVANDWFGICSVGVANFEGVTEPGNVEFGVIDHVTADSTGWDGTAATLETTGGFTEGADWRKVMMSGEGDAVFFKTIADMEVTDYLDGYLHALIYVDDIARLKTYSGMLEISSANTVDEEELYWDLANYVKKSGWNEVYLPLKNASKQGNRSFDATKLNTLRVVMMFNGAGIGGIDELYFVDEKPQASDVVINLFDNTDGCWGNALNSAEGKIDGAVKALTDTSSGDNFTGAICWQLYTDLRDISDFENGYVHAWIYIEDASKLFADWSRFKLGSEGVAQPALEWKFSASDLVSGWNEVYLPMSGASGSADLSAIDSIWFYLYTTNQNAEFRLDDVYMVSKLPTEKIVINGFNSASGCWGDGFEIIETSEAKEGTGYAKATNTSGIGSGAICWAGSGIDISELADTGYLHTWLYLEDASRVAPASRFNLGDGSGYYSWKIGASMLKDGWNELYLPMADASKVGSDLGPDGSVDPSNINTLWFFLYQNGSDEAYYYLDEVSIVRKAPEAEEPVEPEEPVTKVVINNCDSAVGTWGGNVTAVTEEAPEGAAYLTAVNTELGNTAVFCIPGETVDISAMNYLHFSFYIPDLTTAHFEWSNSAALVLKDTAEATRTWYFNTCTIKNGWNEIYLPISDGVGEIDLTKVYFVWAYVYMDQVGSLIGLDDVYACTEKPEVPPVDPVEPEEPAPVVINLFDNADGCWGAGFVGAVEGKVDGAVKSKTASAAGENFTGNICWQIYSGEKDISAFTDGYVHIRFYIEHASTLCYDWSQLQLGSASCGDGTSLKWTITANGLEDGWNELFLPIATAAGSCDLTNINNLYFFLYTSEPDVEFMLDDVYACASVPESEEPPVDPVEPEEPDPVVINLFDIGDGCWGDGYAPALGKVDGAVSAKTVNPAGENYTGAFCWQIYSDKRDISALADGYIHAWIYVEDASTLCYDWSRFKLGSQGVAQPALEWTLSANDLENGWTEVYLPMNEAAGNADLTAIDSIWFYLYTTASGVEFRLDDVYACASIPDPEEEPIDPQEPEEPEVTRVVINECENTDYMWGDNFALVSSGAAQGSAYVRAANAEAGTSAAICMGGAPAVDITGMDYIHFSLYIEDPSNVQYDWGKFNLGDGATNLSWSITADNLKRGWNDIYLKIADAIGSTDLTKINNIWFYLYLRDANTVFGMDEVYALKELPDAEPKAMINPCEKTDYMWGDNFGLVTANTAAGKGAVKAANAAAGSAGAICMGNAPTVDCSAYTHLHISIYIADRTNVQYDWGKFNLGDGTANLSWTVSADMLEDGWSDLYLKFSDATGSADLTGINSIWFYLYLRDENVEFRLDDVYACNH